MQNSIQNQHSKLEKLFTAFASTRTPIRLTSLTMFFDAFLVLVEPDRGFTFYALNYTHLSPLEASIIFLLGAITLWFSHSMLTRPAIFATIPLWAYLYIVPVYIVQEGLGIMLLIPFCLSFSLLSWTIMREYTRTKSK